MEDDARYHAGGDGSGEGDDDDDDDDDDGIARWHGSDSPRRRRSSAGRGGRDDAVVVVEATAVEVEGEADCAEHVSRCDGGGCGTVVVVVRQHRIYTIFTAADVVVMCYSTAR
jgi:hypothetical protein